MVHVTDFVICRRIRSDVREGVFLIKRLMSFLIPCLR